MRRWCKASFLLAAGFLCAGELLVRLLGDDHLTGRFDYGFHPTAGFQESTDGTVQIVRVAGRRFLPQSFPQQRPPGGFRVVVIGNSVAYGPGRLEDSFPWLIGDRLRAQGVAAEGINLAVVGNGARRNQIVLRQALRHQPSLIVLQVDASTEWGDEIDLRRRDEFQGWHPKHWLMKSRLVRRIYEWKTEKLYGDWLPDEVRAQEGVNDLYARMRAQFRTEPPQAQVARDERLKATIRESVALARAAGVPVLLLAQAALERPATGPARLNDGGLDAFTQSLAGDGVGHVSMKKIFEPLPAESLFIDHLHLLRAGHDAIAAAVVTSIREQGWWPR